MISYYFGYKTGFSIQINLKDLEIFEIVLEEKINSILYVNYTRMIYLI